MAKKTTKNRTTSPHPEAKGLIYLGLFIVAMVSLLTFESYRPDLNWLGLVGYSIGWLLSYLFGLTAYGIVVYIGWCGWQMLCSRSIDYAKVAYFFLFLLSCALLMNLFAELGAPIHKFLVQKVYSETVFFQFPYPHHHLRHNLGGVPLYYLYRDLSTFSLQRMLSDIGIAITFSITAIVSLILITDVRILPLLRAFGKKWISWKERIAESLDSEEEEELQASLASHTEIEDVLSTPIPKPIYTPKISRQSLLLKEPPTIEPVREVEHKLQTKMPTSRRQAAIAAQKVYNGDFTDYQLPSPSLLNTPKKIDSPSLKKDLRRQAEILEETLMSFGIEAKVGEIHCGPTITSFEVHPAIGVKVQKITALENDIALNLQAKAIRIIAPIPGKAAVGIEIPSLYPQEVSFKELLSHYQHQPRKHFIPVLLGKTVAGEHVMSDLAKMPHAIIAGATGSGKSVCINTVVMSILMNARPDEIKLLMVDPKKVELTSYTHLPHLIAPVITEPHGAYAALSWLVKEMQQRYDILKQLGLRNISAFNARSINKELEASLNIPIPDRMYAIVAIIDEFADLMMVSSSDLETPIARIAQMARAVGIHLILATQRPSREVITGLIKANFPTRIAFKVASRINSQIILDETGAESLLGNGDMLFLPPGTSHLIRAQGAYISDEEINRVVNFICEQAPTNYLIPSFDNMRKEDLPGEGGEIAVGSRDTLFDQARTMVLEVGSASTTFLQRKLKIGYARAASLMDELEEKHVIGPQEGSKPRRVLQNRSTKASSLQSQEDEEEV